MKISLFTPTNNPTYLHDTYDAIRQQQYENWEWVIVMNGDAANTTLHGFDDARIKIYASQCANSNIGALKREACSLCQGDVFLEMDHDDLLVPGTLPKIAKAFEAGAGFVYSDSAVFENDLRTWGYHESYGWEQYPITVYGKRFIVTKCFPETPRMLCEVYFAPDHVRCWSRKTYYEAGGHDPDMIAGDDHDLVCRTYLLGAKFTHIGCCGYLYRWHDSNTVKLRSRAIQWQQDNNRRKYFLPLVREWAKRNNLPTLDLLDAWKAGQWDKDNPGCLHGIGTHENYYGHIIANDVLQFVAAEKQVEFFNWAWQALAPEGALTVLVPSAATARIADPRIVNARIADPTIVDGKIKDPRIIDGTLADPRVIISCYPDMNPLHRTRFNHNSFMYYTRKEFSATLPGVNCRFDLVQTSEFYPQEPVDPESKHSVWQMLDMKILQADFVAMKGQRHPGRQRI